MASERREVIGLKQLLARVGLVGGWLFVIAALALWLVEAVHRGRLAGIFVVAVPLAAVIVVPLMTARLRS